VVRLLPGALGDEQSAVDESFSPSGLLEYEQYTRPAVAEGLGVPAVLVSGDHARVDRWRRANAVARTCQRRPDLLETADLTELERVRARELRARLDAGDDFAAASAELFPELR
jgi:tRNA (guanine37-N1)-methyltransferase